MLLLWAQSFLPLVLPMPAVSHTNFPPAGEKDHRAARRKQQQPGSGANQQDRAQALPGIRLLSPPVTQVGIRPLLPKCHPAAQ